MFKKMRFHAAGVKLRCLPPIIIRAPGRPERSLLRARVTTVAPRLTENCDFPTVSNCVHKVIGTPQVALKVPFAFPLTYQRGNAYAFSRDLSTIVYAHPGGHADLYLLSQK